MVAGEIRSPYVPLANERIDRRHAHSVALAAFFRHAKQTTGEEWRTSGEFFLPGPSGVAPSTRVRSYLTPVPEEIIGALRRILPESVQREVGVDESAWVSVLADLLEGIRAELQEDVEAFEERRQQAFAERKGWLVERFEKTINTLTKRQLIGFLANRNVLPKYGFPTDAVELRTAYTGDPVGRRLDLSRDLSSAIYEYAPGAELVAGGRLWTSGGVYRLPGRELIGKTTLSAPPATTTARTTSHSPPSARPAVSSSPVFPGSIACPSSASWRSTLSADRAQSRRGEAGTAVRTCCRSLPKLRNRRGLSAMVAPRPRGRARGAG
jgi:hypothetical protein